MGGEMTTAGDMKYRGVKDRLLTLLGFRKIPMICFFSGDYLSFSWEFYPAIKLKNENWEK